GSTNGTFVLGRRVDRWDLVPGTAVHLGNASDGPLLYLSGAATAVPTPQAEPERQPHPDPGPGHGAGVPRQHRPAP
ncbi:hypothetical protein NGM37_48495, partial [Streptomyces sp. TRM76130]|nr:hypothetical protein [Streptomyces sp. TRM76130]